MSHSELTRTLRKTRALRCDDSVSLFQAMSTILGVFGLYALLFLYCAENFLLGLPLAIALGFLNVRIFSLMHDCTHNAYFTSRRANMWFGIFLGAMVVTPFHYWRRDHLLHHSASGDLDRRGHGDIWMLTLSEYKASPAWVQRYYRFYRQPAVFLIFGPVFLFILQMRVPPIPLSLNKELVGIIALNLVLLGGYVALYLLHPHYLTLMAYHLIGVLVAGAIGIWLFFVQHQFEGTYWEKPESWNFLDASYHGSSYLRLPAFLEWLFVRINIHHVHHLDPKIPNYKLKEAADILDEAVGPKNKLSFFKAIRAFQYKLWDEDSQRFVDYRSA